MRGSRGGSGMRAVIMGSSTSTSTSTTSSGVVI